MPDRAFLVIRLTFAAFFVVGLIWVVWAAHKDEPKMRADCEARGGQLIGTRAPLYTCVSVPDVDRRPRH